MLPVGADLWGNPKCWFHLPVGQQLILQTVAESEQPWRLPMLLSAVDLWQHERRVAISRFGAGKGKGQKRKPQ